MAKKKVIVRRRKTGAKGSPSKEANLSKNATSEADLAGLKKRRLVPASQKIETGGGVSGDISKTLMASRTRPLEDPNHEQKFKFFCVWCAQKLSAYDYWAGRELPCPSCKAIIHIPVNPPKKEAGE